MYGSLHCGLLKWYLLSNSVVFLIIQKMLAFGACFNIVAWAKCCMD